MDKLYFSYEETHKIIQNIANQIKNDNWMPDKIIAISGGGLIPARVIRNYLKQDIYIVGLKRYIDDKIEYNLPVKIQWIDEVEKKIKNSKILLIDEIDDTRITLLYCIKELLKYDPSEIRVALLHQKIKKKLKKFPSKIKNVYIGAKIADIWVKYPWDAIDIDEHYKHCKRIKDYTQIS